MSTQPADQPPEQDSRFQPATCPSCAWFQSVREAKPHHRVLTSLRIHLEDDHQEDKAA